MSELLKNNKERVCKNTSGVQVSSRKPMKKVCNENETKETDKEKNSMHVKILLMEVGHL